ncbi:MAG: hypothetical protein P1Q69_17085 [Candidatus Thorarchaeota archaeon]|nr:hypothetical protein [Candidatus Thorarchaeota archaeon]
MTSEQAKEVYVFCNVCKKNILLSIPVSEVQKRKGGLLTVVSLHGDPKHSVLFYLDAEFRVRGTDATTVFQKTEEPTISTTPKSSLPIEQPKGVLRIDQILDHFGKKSKSATVNLSNFITQMILGNNAYLVETDQSPGKPIAEFISMLFDDQNVSLQTIKTGENEKITGLHPAVFDLERKEFLTEGMNIKTHYFEQLLKGALETPNNILSLQNELSKIFYSYAILREILNADDATHLDTKLARDIAIDMALIPILLKMIESEGINTKDRIEFDGLGRAIRSI